MHAWRRLGFRDIHAVVDDVDDHLQHRRDDAAAAGAAGREPGSASIQDDSGRHRTQWPLAALDLVCLVADQAVGIWFACLG